MARDRGPAYDAFQRRLNILLKNPLLRSRSRSASNSCARTLSASRRSLSSSSSFESLSRSPRAPLAVFSAAPSPRPRPRPPRVAPVPLPGELLREPLPVLARADRVLLRALQEVFDAPNLLPV